MPSYTSAASAFEVVPTTAIVRTGPVEDAAPTASSPGHSHIVELRAPGPADTAQAYAEARKQAIHEFERTYVRALLSRCQGNVSRAAREAKIDRVYLHRLIRRHRTEQKAG
jgi:DNA-binding NtrC family response regulator